VNALRDAASVASLDLPATPERMLAALNAATPAGARRDGACAKAGTLPYRQEGGRLNGQGQGDDAG
jgi:hypothetical protein